MLKTAFTDEYRTLIGGLAKAREAKGLSQRDLAEQLAVPQSIVSKIEVGERGIDVVEFIVIAQALGAPPQDIGARIAAVAASSTLPSLA
jgi:ribosome-binding protein aMBF1 (putative translation factor)